MMDLCTILEELSVNCALTAGYGHEITLVLPDSVLDGLSRYFQAKERYALDGSDTNHGTMKSLWLSGGIIKFIKESEFKKE